MHKIFISSLLCLLFLNDCHKSDSGKPAGGPPVLLWKQDVDTTRLTGSQSPLVTPDGVLFTEHSDQNNDEIFRMRDPDTGLPRWSWQDYLYHPATWLNGSLQTPVRCENHLYISAGNAVYNIDLQSGMTTMKHAAGLSEICGIWGADMLAFRNRIEDTAAVICRIDMHSGAEQTLLRIPESGTPFTALSCPNWLAEPGGDTLLYCAYKRYNHQNGKSEAFLYAWNLNGQHFLFPPTVFSQGANPFAPLLHDSLIILEGYREIVALNRFDGRERWRRALEGNGNHQIQLVDGILLASDADKGCLMGLSPETGALRWETPVFGACSMPQCMHGVLYTVSRGDGLLYAVRIADGNLLWNLESPDLARHKYASFSFGVGVDAGKRRLYLSSFFAAYCYAVTD